MIKPNFLSSALPRLRRAITWRAFGRLLTSPLLFGGILLACSFFAHAQVAVSPFQGVGFVQFFDNNGKPLTSGVLYSFQAGTSLQQATYTDSTGTTLNPNPIPFGSGARIQIWLLTGAFYKFVLCAQNDGAFCAPGDVLFSVDQVPGGTNGSGGSSAAPFISNSPNPATTGILRLASSDTICWRNAANSANLCFAKDNADVLSWASGQMKFPENTCGNSALNFDYLCANSTNHRWTMTNNGGAQVQIVAAGQDINTSDFVTQLHAGSTPLPISGTAPSSGQYLVWNGASIVGLGPGTFQVTNEGVTGTTLNNLAKLTTASPSTAIILTTSDLSPLGVVVAGAGTTNSATIQNAGITPCVFDGATTAGDYVARSSLNNGNCHDAGTVRTPQTFAQVLSTNAGVGTFNILWFTNPANPILVYSNTNQSSNVGVGANTLTSVISHAVTMPSSGCPCRAIVNWSMHISTASSEIVDADVTDGSAHFAGSSFNMTGTTSYTGMNGSGVSPVTYSNGQSVTFTAEIENNNGSMTALAAPNFAGFPNSYLTISIVASN